MNLLCVILLSLSTINSLALIFKKGNQLLKNKMLGISLLCYNLSLLVYFLWIDTGFIVEYPHLLRVISPLIYLNAPFFYFYIRNSLSNTNGLKKYDYLHFLPALIHFIDLIPFYILPLSEKREIASLIFKNKDLLNYIGSGIIPISFHYLFRLAIQLGYLIYCLYLVLKLQPQYLKLINKAQLKNWLSISLMAMATIMVSNFCFMMFTYFGENQDQYSGPKFACSLIAFLGILFLNAYINFKPELVYDYPGNPLVRSEFSESTATEKPAASLSPEQEITVKLDIKGMDQGLEKIRLALEQEKVFLLKGITIIDFSKHTGIPPKVLSALINRKFKTNFNELINNYRVEYAIELLDQQILERYSIEGLASMVGFNSRITFFNAFKKKIGYSPKEYMKTKLTATNSVF
ncbi:helix-turn-helix domain-containing protein [Pedobacter gandavensis]|uniref:helix-turn-helix domain-containing protein n=1 Tax=Pedobacter gandavensis TaxID=2679963 RepID=UPI00247AC310|nr:helix-turn-helix domain-containing protein [Pedobacter gandavensis]WGQ11846.1 helix-turn-helix domain-containing protein [Pedobacter gandavensis]